MAVEGVFFWLAGVGGDGRLCAANDRGGDVQQMTEEGTCSERRTTPGNSGSVGEHCDGRRVAAVDDDGGSGGSGRVVGIIIILWLAALREEGAKTRI